MLAEAARRGWATEAPERRYPSQGAGVAVRAVVHEVEIASCPVQLQ